MKYANHISYTDIDPFEVVRVVSDRTLEIREMNTDRDDSVALAFHVGGFAAHCDNQADQRYGYTPNPDGHEIKISLRRWADEDGNERRHWKRAGVKTFEQGGNAYAGRHAFRDFNF